MRARTAHFCAVACVLALGVTAAAPVALGARAATPLGTRLVVVQAPGALPRGAVRTGALASTTRLSLRVVLAPRDPGALGAFIASVSTPSSPTYRHYLARGQFAARFGPTSVAIDLVRSSLRRAGLSVTGLSPSHLVLSVTGAASGVARALHASFSTWRLADGTTGYRIDGPARLPSPVAAYVAGVVGTSSLAVERSFALRGTGRPATHPGRRAVVEAGKAPVACPEASTLLTQNFPGTFSPAQQGAAYGLTTAWDSGDFGAGHTIALVEFAPYATSDILYYDKCFGVLPGDATSDPDLRNVRVEGGTSAGSAAGSDEPTLDIEEIRGLAPDADVVVYEGPNNVVGPVDTLQRIASDDTAQVVSTSWGICEQYSDHAAETPIFEQLAAQGETVYAATGDTGSSDCLLQTPGGTPPMVTASVDDPASQPYVTGVGGLTVANSPPYSATVWNDCTVEDSTGCLGNAAGGGVSLVYRHPAWQTGPGVPTGAEPGASRRDVPDLSVMADPNTGMLAYIQGSFEPYGGTSMGPPLMAALDVDAAEACGTTTFGFLNPLLYAMGRGGGDFDDVTTGTNAVATSTLRAREFDAGTGYDMASGLGSPDPSTFVGALCNAPATASASPTSPGASSSWQVQFHAADALHAGATVTLTTPPGTVLPTSTTAWTVTTSIGSEHPSSVSLHDGTASSTANVAVVTLAQSAPVLDTVTIAANTVVNPRTVGTASIGITDSVDALEKSAPLALSAAVPARATLGVDDHAAGAAAVGSTGIELTVRVTDAAGDLVAGEPLVVRTSGDAAARSTSSTTNDDGEATFDVRDSRPEMTTVTVAAGASPLGSRRLAFTDPWRFERLGIPSGVGGVVGIPAVTAASASGTGFVAVVRTTSGGLVVAEGRGSSVTESRLVEVTALPAVASDPSLARAGPWLYAAYRSRSDDLVVLTARVASPLGPWHVVDVTASRRAPHVTGAPDLVVTDPGPHARLTIGVIDAARDVLEVSAPPSQAPRFESFDASAASGETPTATGNVSVASLGGSTYLFARTSSGDLVAITRDDGVWLADDPTVDAALVGSGSDTTGSTAASVASGEITLLVRAAGGVMVEYVGAVGNWSASVLDAGAEGTSAPAGESLPALGGQPSLLVAGQVTEAFCTSNVGRVVELSSLGVSSPWSSYDLSALGRVPATTSGVVVLPGRAPALLGTFHGRLGVLAWAS